MVNLTSSTPANASGKEVTSADSFQSNLLNYTTNRILEIPQDIKLELNNGTLTLKAGSKVYVPNGFEVDGTTPKFDEFIISNDVVDNDFGNSSKEVMFLMTKSDLANTISVWPGSQVVSGTSAPDFSSTGYWGVWYDTSNNIIKIQDGTNEWKVFRGFSLPFGLVNSSSSAVTSLDQVFNGFGYIGSTIFSLPGIKCQFADGRNEDGSYKSYVKTTDKILTKTFDSQTFNGFDCSLICRNDTIDDLVWYVNEDFDNKSGYIIINKTEGIVKNLCPVFRFFINSSSDNGKISQFIPNPVDKLNWKSTELSGLSMPSSRYIDLTLGASGSTYTAPANGWFSIQVEVSGNNQFFAPVVSGDYGFAIPIWTGGGSIPVRVIVPCTAGRIFKTNYNCTINAVTEFRFIYAQSEQ